MKSWGTEFGYELVGADWELLFPQPDAEMAEVMQAAVEKARARQRQLAAAAPRSYGSQSRRYFRVSPTGGGVIPDQPERSVSEESHEPAQVELPYDRVLAGAEPEASRTAGSPNSAQRSVGSMGGGLPGGGAQAGSGMLPPSGAAPGGTGGVAGQQAESFGATGNSHLLAGPSRAAGEANSSWGSGLGGAGGGVGSAGSARFGPGSGSHDASGQLQAGVGRHGSGPSGPTEAVQTPGGHGAGPGGGTSSGPGSRAPAQQTIGSAGMQNAQDARHLSASGPHAAGTACASWRQRGLGRRPRPVSRCSAGCPDPHRRRRRTIRSRRPTGTCRLAFRPSGESGRDAGARLGLAPGIFRGDCRGASDSGVLLFGPDGAGARAGSGHQQSGPLLPAARSGHRRAGFGCLGLCAVVGYGR